MRTLDYIVKTVTMRGWNAAHAVAVENAVADGTIIDETTSYEAALGAAATRIRAALEESIAAAETPDQRRARERAEAGPSVDVPAAVTHVIPPKPKVPITVCPNCDAPVAECGCGWHCAKGLHERCKGLGCKCWHHRERLDKSSHDQ